MREVVGDFERRINFIPAYHKVDEGKGVGSARMYVALVGDLGAISWELYTDWMLPETVAWWKETGRDRFLTPGDPTAGAVWAHYAIPRHEDDINDGPHDCDLLPDGKCWGYLACSYLAGDEVYLPLVREGEDGLWSRLRQFYAEWVEAEAVST